MHIFIAYLRVSCNFQHNFGLDRFASQPFNCQSEVDLGHSVGPCIWLPAAVEQGIWSPAAVGLYSQ